MNISLSIKFATVATIGASAIAPQLVNATNFNEFAVDQNSFIAVAVPYNYRRYRLAIIEQLPGQQACWSESGDRPTTVDLLLLNFNHLNSCRKAVDSNGYSLRYNGKDDKVEYTLNLIENNGQLQLIADHQDPTRQDLVIGTTNGITEAPMKIELDPNWQFTKRLYQGEAIQHIYLSNSLNPQSIENVATSPIENDSTSVSEESPQPQTQPQPSQPQPVTSQPAPQTPTATVEGLMTQILTPLSQAVYDTYNSLFAPTPTTPPTPVDK